MVVDHQTGDVLAHVGSAGYFDNERNGPIDMTQAVRSPGSALKPFIYGLGFEAGLAHPETLIEDRPTHFGRYAPSNFDNGYRGTVTVRQALQHSLNVPAVKMLAAVSPARLSSRIRHAGFKLDVPRNLAVALGGVGLRLEDLTGLYVALARGGEPVTLRYRMKPGEAQAHPDNIAPTSSERPLLSPLAAWYVGNILRGAPPPPHAKGGGIAFKTGTSYGFRDAWAAGFDGRYVVTVWIGRPDSTPTPGLMGLTEAAPLLFDVFAQIGPNRVSPPSPPQEALFASTASLPPPLKRFREVGTAMAGQPGATPAKPPVRITFPPDRAELEIAHELDGSPTPIAFQVEGGALPFTWLVNDVPLNVPPHRRQVFWTPRDAGFVQFSVIDAEGKVDRVTVRLR
jgi:penicillin-binding protein 1C